MRRPSVRPEIVGTPDDPYAPLRFVSFRWFIVSLLPEIFRGLKDYQDLFYGAGLILLLIYAPKGLAALGNLIPRGSKA